MTGAGKRLVEAAHEALSIAKGDREPAKIFIPADIDVRGIRKKTGLSQDDFAGAFGFTLNQIRDWEQMRSRPTGGLRAYLLLIANDPKGISEALRSANRSAA